jgi:glycosyltransferase involved in cell wall biosynthesis
LVDAAELLVPEVDVSFHIIGDVLFPRAESDYGAWLKQRISLSSSMANITWHPATETPEQAMSMIDILIHTSTSPEPFGRVLVEAMAARRPVVAFRLGSTPDVLGPDWPYFATTPDGHGIAHALALLTGDRGAAGQVARDAQEQAARFAPDKIADQMDGEYGWLAL